MKLLRRLGLWAIGLYALTFLGVVGQTAFFRDAPLDELEPVDVIVCLGAGMDPDARLHRSATARVERCAGLYAAGLAPRVHFTGGQAVETGPAAGERMARLARTLGVPPDAITTENRSQSTLQNALFSQPMLSEARSIRIVTEGFHLPRSHASFAVMGDHRIYWTMSEPVRRDADGTWNWTVLMREAAAVWFNAARYILWNIMDRLNIRDHDTILA